MAARKLVTWFLALLIATGAGLALALSSSRIDPAAAAGATDITGTWDLPAGSVAKQSWTFTSGDGALAGEGGGGPYTWPMEGTNSGGTVQIKTAYRETSYTAYFVGTVSADGATMSGTWSTGGFAAAAVSASTWTANRRGGAPTTTTTTTTTTPAGTHPTGVQVICNRGPNPGDGSVCTATVGDGSTTETPTAPSGTVTFSALNGGGFPLGATCTLVPTSGSPSVSSCAVQYAPPIGSSAFPDIVAEYGGDSTHATSSGRTSMIFGPVFGLDGKKVVTKGGPATAQQCKAAATAATGPLPKGGKQATASLVSSNPMNKPTATLGDWVYHCGWSTVANLTVMGGYLTQAAALPAGVGTTGTMIFLAAGDPEPTSKYGLATLSVPAGVTVSVGAWKAGEALVGSGNKQLNDPPDPKFTVTARPRTVQQVTFVAKRPGQRRHAKALGRYATRQLRIAALADALGATLDKAGGARQAGNTTFEGKQMRAAVGYSRRMLLELVQLRREARPAAAAIRALPGANVKFDAALLKKAEGAAKGKPKPAVTKALRRLGLSTAQIKAMLAASAVPLTEAEVKGLPKDLAELVGGRQALELIDMAILSQRYYRVEPSVVAMTKLK